MNGRVRRALISLTATGIFGTVAGCHLWSGGSKRSDTGTGSQIFTREAERLWYQHVEAQPLSRLQKGCEPTHVAPPAGVEERGVVMAFHGYSACPQQFFELANLIAAKGFHVLIPLLPGHGRMYNAENKDNVSELPKREDWRQYSAFVRTMNDVVQKSSGDKVTIGLSLGGAMAAYAGATGQYSRQMVMVPMFELGLDRDNPTQRAFENWLLRLTSVFPQIGNKEQSWGEGCRTTEREGTGGAGRAGICDFQTTHVVSAALFGKEAEAAIRQVPIEKRIPTQFIGVDSDPAVNNTTFTGVIKAYRKGFSRAQACFYREPANHSLLSRFDAPSENKFWLSRLLTDAVAFIVEEKALSESESKSREGSELHHCPVE